MRVFLIGVSCLGLAAACLGVAHEFIRSFQFQWNGSRLAVIYAAKLGYGLYYAAEAGPVLNTIYGPLAYYPYLPATLFHDPTSAIAAGQALSVLFYIAPLVLWLVWISRQRSGAFLLPGIPLLAAFIFCTLTDRGLVYSAFNIHSDAPALFFLGMGLLATRTFLDSQNRRALVLAGLLMACSVWAKQTTIAACVAPLLVLVFSRRFRDTLIFSVAALASAVLLGLLFIFLHGGEELALNLFRIPAGHPWRTNYGSGIENLFGHPLVWVSLLTVSVSLLTGFLLIRRGERDGIQFVEGPALFFIAGVLLMPFGVLGYVKNGGDDNSFSAALYCLLFATGEAVFAFTRCGPEAVRRRFSRVLAFVAIPAMLAIVCIVARDAKSSLVEDWERIPRNPNQQAFDYLERRPGRIWFPMLPLAHLMAEGKLYHFSRALQEREMAGLEISRREIRRWTPERFRAIAFRFRAHEDDPREYLLEKFPEFQGPVETPGLKAWQVYRRTKSPRPVTPEG